MGSRGFPAKRGLGWREGYGRQIDDDKRQSTRPQIEYDFEGKTFGVKMAPKGQVRDVMVINYHDAIGGSMISGVHTP